MAQSHSTLLVPALLLLSNIYHTSAAIYCGNIQKICDRSDLACYSHPCARAVPSLYTIIDDDESKMLIPAVPPPRDLRFDLPIATEAVSVVPIPADVDPSPAQPKPSTKKVSLDSVPSVTSALSHIDAPIGSFRDDARAEWANAMLNTDVPNPTLIVDTRSKSKKHKAQRGDKVPLVADGRFVAVNDADMDSVNLGSRDVMLSVTPETALFVGALLGCLIVCSLLFCARRNLFCGKSNAEGVIAKSIDDLSSDECAEESEDEDEYESTPEPKAERKVLV